MHLALHNAIKPHQSSSKLQITRIRTPLNQEKKRVFRSLKQTPKIPLQDLIRLFQIIRKKISTSIHFQLDFTRKYAIYDH